MPAEDLEVVDGAVAGAWIAPRLEGGFGGKVEQLIPNGYDAHVRIFHPTTDGDGEPATWAMVAEATGRTAHREMQWHRLIGADEPLGASSSGPWQDPGKDWPGGDPLEGEMEEETLANVCAILAAHTADPSDCFFGLSTIHGGVHSAYPEAVQLHWRSRDFVVFAGPLAAADQVGYEASAFWSTGIWSDGRRERIRNPPHWRQQAPNLIWPADRTWFVQTEIDLDSTLVGGSRALGDALLASPELEAWEVERGDSLEAWADRVN